MIIRICHIHSIFLILLFCLFLPIAAATPTDRLWQPEQSQAGKDAD